MTSIMHLNWDYFCSNYKVTFTAAFNFEIMKPFVFGKEKMTINYHYHN